MSLSKLHFIPTANTITYYNHNPVGSSPTGFWSKLQWPSEIKWTTVASIAAPVVVLGAGVGYFYWKKKNLDAKKTGGNGDCDGNETIMDPNKPMHLILKEAGNNYFKANNYGKALENYNAAIDEKPPGHELALLYQNRAAVYEKLNDYVQVTRECTAALQLNPVYVKALTRRSKAYQETGFLDEALEDVTCVCILESFKHTSSVQLADTLLMQIGNIEADKIIKNKKPEPPTVHQIAAFMRSFHNDPISIIWNNTKLAIPNKESSHMNGESEFGAGEQVEVVELKGYKLAVTKLGLHEVNNIMDLCTQEINTPDSKYILEAYLLRGTFRLLWNYRTPTLDDFNFVIKNENANNELKSSAWIKKGIYYSFLPDFNDDGKQETWSSCLDEAKRLTPNNVDVFHQRGQIALMRGQIDEAKLLLSHGSVLGPDFPLAHTSKLYLDFRFAKMEGNETGVNEIIRDFSKCIRKFSTSPDVYCLYGQMLLECDRIQEATEQFDKVIQLEPNNPTVFVHKAMLEYRMTGDAIKALSKLEEARLMDDKSEFIHETIGTLCLQIGDLDGAANSFTKAVQLARTHQEITMLSSMKKAAEIQSKIKVKLGVEVPTIPINMMPTHV